MSIKKHFEWSKSAVLRRAIVPMAAALSLPVFVMAAGASSADNWVSTSTQAHLLSSLVSAKDALKSGEAVHVVVSLKLRNADALENFLSMQDVPGSPSFGASITQENFVSHYSPTAAQAQAVADHLTASGFRNVTIAPNRLLVEADGTAGTVKTAFRTELAHVMVGSRSATINLKAPQVPAALDGIVESVLGLQTADVMHTMAKRADAVLDGSAKTNAVHGFNPTVFPTVYHAGTTPTASKTTVAIVAEGDLTQTLADLSAFETANGITPITPVVTLTGAASTDTSGTPEWDLDSQDIIAMTGGVAKLIFYDGPSLSNSDLTTEFNKVVTDNLAKVINVSLGECESSAKSDGSLKADDTIFKQAKAQGQTFSISTGDSGSDECYGLPNMSNASSPASSPYVVAVGGTTLSAHTNNTYSSEKVWSDTGGSPSKVEKQQTWQAGYVPQTTYRGLADIAFDADPNTGAIIIVNGSSAQYGGTSLAAPLFTAAWARIETSHSNKLGFAAPLFYAAYGKSSTPFHDVTSGKNGVYSATVGWDYPTGFGSFDIQLLNAGL